MKKTFVVTVALFVWLGSSAVTRAQATDPAHVSLKVGDAAPDLAPGKWLKGEPVERFEKDKIYVVDFWATWCPTCRARMPHLSKLQEQFKDIVFIGQDCGEDEQGTVPGFVKEMGDKMSYRVVLDDMTHSDEGKMWTAWMHAAGLKSLPTAFVVDKQTRIAWIGDPGDMDDVLKELVAGTFDPKKAEAELAAQKALEEKFDTAIKSNDIDGALAVLDPLIKAEPRLADRGSAMKFELLVQKKDYAAAWELGRKLAASLKDQPGLLAGMAWAIVTPEGPAEKPDLELAESLASRAAEVTKGEDAEILDILARVYFTKGNFDKAIDTEAKALAKTSKDQRAAIRKTLDEYTAAKENAGKSNSK